MMSRRTHALLTVVTLVIATLVTATSTSTPANAAEMSKKECIDANAQAQIEEQQGHFRASQAMLRSCALAACPQTVRDDCAQRLDALERTMPSIVFEAKDGAGVDLSAVRVTIDGRPLVEKLDGTAISVDLGEHEFTFQGPTGKPVTKKLVIRAGERARREEIVLGPPPAKKATPADGADSQTRDAGRTQKTIGLVVGGAGVLGIAIGGVLGGLAGSKWSSSKDECKSASDCSNHDLAVSDHDSATHLATGSTIGFIAGGVLLGAGIGLYVTAPKRGASTTASLKVVPNIGGALLVGSF